MKIMKLILDVARLVYLVMNSEVAEMVAPS